MVDSEDEEGEIRNTRHVLHCVVIKAPGAVKVFKKSVSSSYSAKKMFEKLYLKKWKPS